MKNARGRYVNSFNDLEPHAIISYHFGKGERLIPTSETSRVYPSNRDKIKRNLEKREWSHEGNTQFVKKARRY